MYRELTGIMDIHVSHDLSRRKSVRSYDNFWSIEKDQHITSKIENNFNNARGMQK